MNETALRTWYLTEDEIAATIAKLEKINQRAVKNGLEGRYTWTFGEDRRTPVYDESGVRLVINGIPHYIEKGQPVPCPIIGWAHERELVVFGDAPKLGGWKFVACLTWEGGVLVTRTHPEFDGRIDDSQIRESACDHCKVDRMRYDCYLLEGEDGQRVQVGSSCVKDFLGHSFRPSMISLDGDDLDEIERSHGPRQHADAAVEDVLTWAASMCSQTGWVSKNKAEIENRIASTYVLQDCLFGTGKAGREARDKYQPTDDNKTEAEKVLAWARELEPGNSEYLANVKRCAQANFIAYRNVAVLGSAVASYWREQNEKIERAARPVSQHVGQIKDRLVVAVTVKGDTAIDGYYGVTHLYTLTDAAGNVFKWFSSRSQGWEIGQEIKIKGTVKGHETWKDVKQTVLTRCAEIALVAACSLQDAPSRGRGVLGHHPHH